MMKRRVYTRPFLSLLAGRVSLELVQQLMPPSTGERTMILVCGPPGFMEAVSGDKAPDKSQGPLMGLLKQLGYKAEQVYKF
jgi:cytochrome-b5 reductase